LATVAGRLPVWYGDGIRFECQQSGRCCTNHGEYAWVYPTPDDERRLARHLGLDRRRFRRQYTRLLDGWRVLESRADGCVFLDGRRCGVYPARPVQCATWPFWRDNLDPDTWQREVASFCPGVGKGRLWSRDEIDAQAALAAGEEAAEPLAAGEPAGPGGDDRGE
jgi:hypothetical protein